MQKPLLQTDMRTIHGGFSISTVYHPQPVMVLHHIPSNRCHQNMAEKIERPKWVLRGENHRQWWMFHGQV